MLKLLQFLSIISIQAHADLIVLNVSRIPQRLLEKMASEHPVIPNRLLSPVFNESIAHILMNPLEELVDQSRYQKEMFDMKKRLENYAPEEIEAMGITELVRICSNHLNSSVHDIPVMFPRFLCGLSAIYREFGLPRLNHTRVMFSRPSEAIRSLNNVENYPCHSMNMTDVVALVPGRIYSGCVDDRDPLENSQLTSAFVMSHPFPDALKPCFIHPICELRSMIYQHRILYQHEDCCCEGQTCALLIFSQTTSLTPLVIKTIDLSKETLVPLKKTTTTPKPSDYGLYDYDSQKQPDPVDPNIFFG